MSFGGGGQLEEEKKKKKKKKNQSPKGNMWLAIPVALLYMLATEGDGKQGSGPEGDDVL